jgi:hypothetical protein
MSAVIKYFNSSMAGAPQLTNTAGSMKGILDACLNAGWGLATVTSVTISGGIATVTLAGHPFEPQSVALISGATVSGSGTINGEQVVLTATSTTYTFATSAVGTVTGTVQHKVAPLGWNVMSGTNIGAYQITGSGGTGMWLRVDDTGTGDARVTGYETMSVDVNTGTNQFPTAVQQPGGLYWAKSTAVAGNRSWMLLGDDRGFYMNVRNDASTTNYTYSQTFGFGDFSSLKAGDIYNCFINGSSAVQGNTSYNSTCDLSSSGVTGGATYSARPYTGTGSPVLQTRHSPPPYPVAAWVSGAATAGINYPNPSDGSLLLTSLNLLETSGSTLIRGSIPGIYFVAQNCSGVFAARDIVTGVSGLSGRSFRVMTPNDRPLLIDNTGPWSR